MAVERQSLDLLSEPARYRFDILLEERIRLQQLKAQEEQRIKKIDEELMPLLLLAGIEKTETETHTIGVSTGENKTIQGHLLLARGVDPEIIKQATKVTAYTFMDVRAKKAKKEGE